MEKPYNILMVGIQPWDIEIGSNFKNMALELSLNHRVIYVNSPLDRLTALTKRKDSKVQKRLKVRKGKKKVLEQINSNLWIFSPPIIIESIQWLPNLIFSVLNEYNNRRIASTIRPILQKMNFKDFILLNDSDMFRSFHLKKLLKPKAYIYYTRDNLMTVPYWKKHGKHYEPELMHTSDLVIGNSPHLISYARQFNSEAHFIGQGCETKNYSTNRSFTKPDDMASLDGKIIGYTGLLSSRRLDIELIHFLAKSEPEWNFVLIGPEESCFAQSKLHKLPNIHFLGNKKPEELANYVAHFDLCFNPQAVNELTLANYPRKIDEYLAAGKGIVATKTPTMMLFEKVVHLASSKRHFLQLLHAAINEECPKLSAKRQAVAKEHTWSTCIERFWKAYTNITL